MDMVWNAMYLSRFDCWKVQEREGWEQEQGGGGMESKIVSIGLRMEEFFKLKKKKTIRLD